MNAVVEYLVESTRPFRVSEEAPWAMTAEGLSMAFGGQRVLEGLNLTLLPGEAVLVRGENGSGKTTLLNIISGLIRPDAGSLRLRVPGGEMDVTRASPEQVARAGLGRLWQDIRLFPTMTVLDNVIAASPNLRLGGVVAGVVGWPWQRHKEQIAREQAMQNLDLVGMADRAQSSADMLSVGQMKRVAIARLLQTEASLWLLDEPLAGLDQVSAEGLLKLLERLNNDEHRTLLIIEHQHERMAPLCDRTCFLADGCLSEGGVS